MDSLFLPLEMRDVEYVSLKTEASELFGQGILG